MTSKTRSEDTWIFFALNRDYTDFDLMIPVIEEYMQRKQAQDPTDRFNFCAFEAHGPIYYEDFLLDTSYISRALNDVKETLAVPNLTGGIFLGLTNIIETFKLVSGKCYRIIVLMDQGTLLSNSTYVLQSIMDQVIDFPIFIDFVRVNTEEIPQQDVELLKFAQRNNSTIYFAQHREEIPKVLDALLKKKELARENDTFKIPTENIPFFNNLGADLWIAESEEENPSCQICRKSEGDLVMCPQCHTITHAECLAQWAKFSNIGLPYLFRCLNCYRLLRLPADFVLEVQAGTYKKPVPLPKVDQAEMIRQRESQQSPALVQTGDQLWNLPSPDMDTDEDGWATVEDDSELRIKFCECGAMNLPEAVKCAQCGKPLH